MEDASVLLLLTCLFLLDSSALAMGGETPILRELDQCKDILLDHIEEIFPPEMESCSFSLFSCLKTGSRGPRVYGTCYTHD